MRSEFIIIELFDSFEALREYGPNNYISRLYYFPFVMTVAESIKIDVNRRIVVFLVPCHLSEGSSVRRFTCPKVHLSEGSYVRRFICPKVHLSEGSLVRRFTCPKITITSKNEISKNKKYFDNYFLKCQMLFGCIHAQLN